ncbi:MAG: chromate transporter [Oscillospiraceae bacterium]|nr:chromate transporter [Oscillospiraceae bacterium]
MMAGLLELFILLLPIGALPGGGLAVIAVIQEQMVSAGLMTAAEAVNIVAISEMTPGALATSAATFVGMRLYGLPGAMVATAAISLPTLVIVTLVVKFFSKAFEHKAMRAVLSSLRVVVLGILASVVVIFGRTALFGHSQDILDTALILAMITMSFWVMWKKWLSPPLCILIAGLFGALFLR